MITVKKTVLASVLLLGQSLLASPLLAQDLPGSQMAQQSLRPYWHVFIAYAIAIALVLAWVMSIGKRLREVEERLGQ